MRDFYLPFCFKGVLSSEQLVNHNCEAPNISLCSVFFIFHNLRRHVKWSAEAFLQKIISFVGDSCGNTEVDKLDDHILVEEQILLLDVAVNDVVLMNVKESKQGHNENVHDLNFTKLSILLLERVKIAIRTVFDDQADELFCFK